MYLDRALIAPQISLWWYLVLMGLLGCFMVNSFLFFAATNKLEIYYYGFGLIELRLVFIAVNTIVIFAGTGHFEYRVLATCGFPGFIVWVVVFVTRFHACIRDQFPYSCNNAGFASRMPIQQDGECHGQGVAEAQETGREFSGDPL